MSPHNHARFNGSNLNSPHSYHSNQNDLAIAFEKGMSYMGKFLYTISGLRFFYTRRIFKRGIGQEKEFSQELLNLPLQRQYIGPNHGMMIHPSYIKSDKQSNPNDLGIIV